MSLAHDLLPLAALLVLVAMALWFSLAARTHFNEKSPRRPLMFALEAVSLAICLGTIGAVVFGSPHSIVRSALALAFGCGAGLLFSSALRATRNRKFGVVFGGTVPDAIIDHGPYHFIRHPLYTAYLLNWIGCFLVSGSILIGLGSVAIAVLYLVAARGEERDLLNSPQGWRYAEYRCSTGLFLPRLRKGTKP
jgi:protein-S-isoprenylcysteine O-methyltransferase Ste14